MAHPQQREFVGKLKDRFPNWFHHQKVLEVGSLNLNGTIRDFFNDCKYTGIDVGFGKDVDIVCEGQNYNAPDNSYDVVCSLECFEHNPFWIETFQNMIRLCKDDGFVFFTCATEGRPEHGTTRTSPQDSPLTVNIGWDYYHNLNENDFRNKLNFDSHFSDYGFEVNSESHDLYFWGIVSKNKLEKIPVIGVPIVNGVHWLERLIESIDYPVKDLFIVNNNGRGQITKELDRLTKINHPYIDHIKVSHLPSNIGCSGAWNLIVKCYMLEPYWIIVNNDVSFTPGLLEEVVEKSKNSDIGIIKPITSQWDLFLIKDWVIQKVGLFDENFYPAYVEDCDYRIRLNKMNVKEDYITKKYLHGEDHYETTGSQTARIDPSLHNKLHHSRILNETEYINHKWGPTWVVIENDTWDYQPWENPFNNSDLPITYTTYDLNFVRRKHLGF